MKALPTTIRRMNHLEIGWVAGVIEGEGCIRHAKRAIRIDVAMSDRDVIDGLQLVTGVGKVYEHKHFTGSKRKPMYVWVCARRNDVFHLLTSIVPILGERRRAQVVTALNGLEVN